MVATDFTISLPALIQRLTLTPDEFKMQFGIGKSDRLNPASVLGDLLYDLSGERPDPSYLRKFEKLERKTNYLRAVMYACHLFNDASFKQQTQVAERVQEFLGDKLLKLSSVVDADLFLTDPERREELARQCIAAALALPSGESKHVAEDRLNTVDSLERARVIEETRKSQQRAREIREAIQKKEAEEAASKWSRE